MRLHPNHILPVVLSWLQVSVALPAADALIARTDASSDATRGRTSIEVRDGIKHTVFEHEATGARIDFVSNSGICETTPGVAQHSGYLNVGGKPFSPNKGDVKI
jgi:hypothetical protein